MVWTKRNLVILLNLLLLLGFFNWSVLQKERILAHGKLVLLQLAPVDPRSLLQGDYMRLNYAISQPTNLSSLPSRGYVVVRVGAGGMARLVRYQEETNPLKAGEQLIRYSKTERSIQIGAESYFFEEGQGEVFAAAAFGGLKVDQRGNSVLVGLYTAQGQLIRPRSAKKR
ncbi:GDYXXLXY domain-containing protein [Pontibacter sp. E15-1]|uniref:GDYXXLXY domain-containing protein n=1 Tax=Pontibacter sp. E15-1 TaxID=2919918 RepID=UPI001F4FD7B9|nr:GDYXXLXY domain-containing protein [Pontibacter sp. E15-1]MCJ8165505.1 GDYXXLXY domain-containing protein [Pontibacter sp. E15-1]